MIFGAVPVSEAADSILAHSLKASGIAFKKGRRLSEADVETLREAGIEELTVARLEADEIHEDAAATALAAAIRSRWRRGKRRPAALSRNGS